MTFSLAAEGWDFKHFEPFKTSASTCKVNSDSAL